uniref:Tyrosine-protein kinase ephrin type A/B receptor-like domain-containing protein n=1 Tax=Chromera velia CCMP2878 TaxID=1169474 RepID=A0A0G4HVB9_9ALVE|eukprot:Cvel_32202.t1-p1 / transcript=Cvel_32202.t1 / gene=Cvel_32202 / organism=Chromera_velia_CCMP2878 / gene_product=hypothetical protein / transcript_product=hypothetical protein / location=Cvel_scaffold4954:2174-5728(+) / protein_length=824 / sequence_SO=supercontig / SO=protein_coding / is_pseudo=false
MSACRSCPVGYYRNSSQSPETCERCPLGTFNSATGRQSCQACKDTKTTEGFASIAETDCTCKEGSFLNKVTDTCDSCLDALRCEGGDGIPSVQPGYWATADSADNFGGPSLVLHCYRDEEVCKGGPIVRETKEDITRASRRLAGSVSLTDVVDPNCEPPRFGPMCNFCPLGTFKSGRSCRECFAGFGGFPLFALVLAVIALVILCYFTVNHKDDVRSHATTHVTVTFIILLNFLQQLAVVQKLQFRTTGIVHDILRRFAYLNFDMEGIRRECFLPEATGFEIYMFTASLPLLPLCASALCYGVSQLLNRYIWSKIPPWDLNKTINMAGFFLSTIYVSICTLTLAPFLCIPHPKGHTTLELFPSVTCGSEEHSKMEVLGAVAIVVYIFGFLSFLSMVSLGAPKWDQTHPGFATRYNFMIGDCHPKYWWWPVMNLTKNLLIAVVPLMETDNGGIQIVSMMLVFHVFLVLHVCFWPWRDSVNNWVDLSATVVFLCLLTGMMAWTDHTAASNSVFTVVLLVLLGGQLCVSTAVIAIGLERCSRRARRRERGMRENLKARLFSTVQKLGAQTDEAGASITGRNWLITLLACPDSDIESIDRFIEICEAEFLHEAAGAGAGAGGAPCPMNARKRGTQAYFGVVANTLGISSRKHVSGRRLKVSVAAAAKSVGVTPAVFGERQKTQEGGLESLQEEDEPGEEDDERGEGGEGEVDGSEVDDEDFEVPSERIYHEERGRLGEGAGRFHLREREGEATESDSVLGSPVAIRMRPQESALSSVKSEDLENLDIGEEDEEEDERCMDMSSPLRGAAASPSRRRPDGFFSGRNRRG